MEGVDLFSLDGQQALLCRAGNATNKDVKRFLRTANCLFEVGEKGAHPAGKLAVTGAQQGALKVLRVHAGSLLYALDGPRLQRLCRLPKVAERIRRSAEEPDQEESAPALLRHCHFRPDIWPGFS